MTDGTTVVERSRSDARSRAEAALCTLFRGFSDQP
jgi:hypothetical protein